MEFLKIWEIILRRKWIIIGIFLAFFFTTVLGTHLIIPTYKSQAKLLVKTSDTLSSMLSSLGLSNFSGGKGGAGDTDHDTNIALATIRPLLEELITALDLRSQNKKRLKPEYLEKGLMSRILPHPYIEVDQYEDTDLLEISAVSPDAAEASNMSNKLAELYIKDRRERITEEYRAARIFIENQLLKVKDQYYQSLADLRNFKIKEVTVDLDLETQNLINKIGTLKSSYEDNEETIRELETEIAQATAKLKSVREFRKESKEYVQNEEIKNLKTRLHDFVLDIAQKSIDITKEHPEYKQLEKEIETAKNIIEKEARVVLNSERVSVNPIYEDLSNKLIEDDIKREIALAKRNLLLKYISEYEDELLKIPVKYTQGSKLELALSVNKEMYQNLLEYLMQVGVAESMTLSDIRLVEAAIVTDRPNFPKKLLNYVIGVFLGVTLGLAFAFFMEYIDNTIKNADDIKHFKSLALLGTVPKVKTLRNFGIISDLPPNSPIIEAYRTIRNSIRYASIDKPIKSIVITSSIQSEGKSCVATNLAINMCTENKKVILVDMDLRRPSVYRFFDISNRTGITNVLAEGISLDSAIVKSKIDGLDILPSGPVPPDPSKLIESQRVKDIIHILKEKYDFVVIDSPPIMAVNDAIIIGPVVEGMLYLVEAGKATFSMVEHVQERIGKAGINLLGIILNKFNVSGSGYYYYYYYNRYYKK